MNKIDQQKAARVWQRVQDSKPAPTPPRLDNLQELIMNEWEAAATYQQLARQLPQKEAAVLQRLSREEHHHGACLRGMYALVTGEKCEVHSPSAPKEARAGDPEYGHVFARIAQQEQEHCMALLSLIGSLGGK